MCVKCGAPPVDGQALCGNCAKRLKNPAGLCPEHIAWTGEAPELGVAALVDQWGRAHYLREPTVVGRIPDDGIAVLDASISRQHAELALTDEEWSVRDLDSRNGTVVAGKRVKTSARLKSEHIVSFGEVSFYFLAGREIHNTTKIKVGTAEQARPADPEPPPDGSTLRLSSPPGDVGGIVELNGVPLRLSAIQFEFVSLLAKRIRAEADQPPLVRGYVRSDELLEVLPWDTAVPVANNVKQLVRRVRAAMHTAEFGNVIESRHRFGYRLRFMPHDVD